VKPITPDSDPVTALLARFPDPVTLYPSRRKWLVSLAVAACFVVIGVLILRDPARFANRWSSTTEILAVGWLCVVFFGLGAILSSIILIPGASWLTLDTRGFMVRNLFRTTSRPWADVDNFAAVDVARAKKLVGYDDAQGAGKAFGRLSVLLSSRNSALPDSYGLSEADLASLMTQWRSRALMRG
jgi:hypothetical protein